MQSLIDLGLIGLAGSLGAILRYGISTLLSHLSFPWATFFINLSGSMAFGWIMGCMHASPAFGFTAEEMRIWTTGFLGGYTTFSTFCIESLTLSRRGKRGAAFIYVAASLLLGFVGYEMGQEWGTRMG